MSIRKPSTDTLVKPLHLLVSIAIFIALFALSYPYYRYFVDPDAVAYLTIARRTAQGDYWRLVNALWSPFHPALVAICIRFGVNELLAAQLTNAAACVIILCSTYSLFRRFKLSRFAGSSLLFALSAFLVYALYKQLFCDLWQVAFLLIYLRLITGTDFLTNTWKIVACGVIMALAAYAKVYSFYFLLLHFPIALLLLKKPTGRPRFPRSIYGIVLAIQLVLLSPWVLLMHHKYGGWSLSKSGALNTSWTLTGHKTLRDSIHALIPPPYPNSPYTWEDPYLAEGRLHSRFESLAMIKSQVGHTIQATLQGINVANEISPFLLAVLFGSLLVVLYKRDQELFGSNHVILIAAACIMPVGYLLLHFEARYIWLLSLVAMILGAQMLEAFWPWTGSRRAYKTAVSIFALSFVAYPIYDLKALFRSGEDVYKEAITLKSLGIHGSFTTDDAQSRSGALAYWLQSGYHTPAKAKVSASEVLDDIQRYHIKYYFHYSRGLDVTQNALFDDQGRPFPVVSSNQVPGLTIFLANP